MNESYFHCLLKFQKKFLWPSLENTIIDLSHLNKLFCLINYLSLKLFIFYHSITIFQGKDDKLKYAKKLEFEETNSSSICNYLN